MAGVKGRSGGPRPNSGGARPGAGRKKSDPVLIASADLLTSDPKRFLTALMNDPAADIRVRADAAKALLTAELRAKEAKGKKEEKQEAANKVAGKFSRSAPPKLVAAGGKKV